MTTLPEPVKTPDLSELLTQMLNFAPEAPPDMVTRLRGKLDKLPAVARAIYPRENLTHKTSIAEAVTTVLYYFDYDNRQRVAAALTLTYIELMILLCGYELGREA